MNRPENWEYADFYGDYVANVPEGDVLGMLDSEGQRWQELVAEVSEGQAERRPRENQWSIKEILGHLADAERVFGYRALVIARGDKTPLPAFEQDDYAREADSNRRPLKDLMQEFLSLRHANLMMFCSFSELGSRRTGTVNGALMSVRALAYIICGHEMRHLKLLRARMEAERRTQAV